MTAKKEEEFDLEAALARIEEITALLSSSETSLKDSVKLYQEGMELTRKCQENLEGVEKQLQILNPENDDEI